MADLPKIMQVGEPLPKSLGACADLYHDIREIRLAMEKEAEEVKARETEIQEHIIASMPAGDTGAAGLRYKALIKVNRKPRISDEKGGWPIFWSWIRKNDFMNMVQRRINEKALEEYMEQNPERETIPGTEFVQVKTVSITKV